MEELAKLQDQVPAAPFEKVKPTIEKIASIEGLEAHKKSVSKRV